LTQNCSTQCAVIGVCRARRFDQRPAPAMKNIESSMGMDAMPRAQQ
jgi:hypothetical protein